MSDVQDLLRAIEATVQSVDHALTVANEVEPPGHRVEMTKTQLESAREILVRARGFLTTKGSGTYSMVTPKKP